MCLIQYSSTTNNETLISLRIESIKTTLTISGYSRAGLKTSILIKELNVVFDMGYVNEQAFSFDNKLISHGHADHIGSLHFDYNARKLYNIKKNRLLIMPDQCIKPFLIISSSFSHMNCGKCNDDINIFDSIIDGRIISSESIIDDYYNLISRSDIESIYWTKSIKMDHKILSFAYIIYRKSRRLKTEYAQIMNDKKAIIELKKQNIDITIEFMQPIVAYTGDTSIESVITNDELLNVPLLIMECTGFGVDDITDCQCGKHIHINDINKYADKFQNEKIILFHFSQKYKTLEEIQQLSFIDNRLKDKIIFFF